MNAEFDWWLLLVGIVAGAALVWLVVGDMRRRDDEVADDERSLEAEWIADAFGAAGRTLDAATVAEILDLHRAYLAGPAPELDPVDQVRMPGSDPLAADGGTADAVAGDVDPARTRVPTDEAPDVIPPAVRPPAPGPGGAQPRRAPGDGS